jgi:hypothetical protein
MLSSDTSILAANATGIVPNSTVTIDNEKIAICNVSGNTLTVGKSSCPNVDGRGFDGTSAASHANGALVSLNIDAWHHNAMKAEVEAIESALGVNLGNVTALIPNPMPINKGGTGAQTQSAALAALLGSSVVAVANGGTGVSAAQGNGSKIQMAGTNSGVAGAALCNDAGGNATTSGCVTALPWVNASDYNFAVQSPTGSISAGSNAISLAPCPLGVNGTDTHHWIRLAGTGTPEAALITGGKIGRAHV